MSLPAFSRNETILPHVMVLCGLQAMQDDIACIAALASQSIMALMGVFILFVRLYKDVFNGGMSLSKFVGCCPVCQ